MLLLKCSLKSLSRILASSIKIAPVFCHDLCRRVKSNSHKRSVTLCSMLFSLRSGCHLNISFNHVLSLLPEIQNGELYHRWRNVFKKLLTCFLLSAYLVFLQVFSSAQCVCSISSGSGEGAGSLGAKISFQASNHSHRVPECRNVMGKPTCI